MYAMPQSGIIPLVPPHQAYVIVHLKQGYDKQSVLKAVANMPVIVGWNNTPTSTDKTQPTPGVGDPGIVFFTMLMQGQHNDQVLHANVGFSEQCWNECGFESPAHMKTFTPKGKEGKRTWMPATGGDLILHVKSTSCELTHIVVEEFRRLLGSNIETFDVVYSYGKPGACGSSGRNAFGYFDATSRTVTLPPEFNCGMSGRGNEDFHALAQNAMMDIGPMMKYCNKSGKKLSYHVHDFGRIATALIRDDAKHINGSFMLTQIYVFDRLDEFLNLPVPMVQGEGGDKTKTQDGVFGRVKELGYFAGLPNDIPANCHTMKNFEPIKGQAPGKTVDSDFIERNIYRQAGGFAKDGVECLFFAAYSCDTDTFEILLGNMSGDRVDINKNKEHDLVLNYAKCISGQYWYMPNLTELSLMANSLIP